MSRHPMLEEEKIVVQVREAHGGPAGGRPVIRELAPNGVGTTGGERLRRVRCLPPELLIGHEEWIGATTHSFADATVGPARLSSGEDLRRVISSASVDWLGESPRSDPADSGILFKLIDLAAGAPVHVHPAASFAADHLGSACGKSEAWLILEAEPGAGLHVGWTQTIDGDELSQRRIAGDVSWMLERMHRIPATPGTVLAVPAGQVHAVSGQMLLAEVQQPVDLSILIEQGGAAEDTATLGLGWDLARRSVDLNALDAATVAELTSRIDLSALSPGVVSLLPSAVDELFAMSLIVATGTQPATVPGGFGVIVVLDGEARASWAEGECALRQGGAYVVPAGIGDWNVGGAATLLLASPPDARHG